MKNMKDSGIDWIDKIPNHWRIKRIKYCAAIDSDKLSETTPPDYCFHYIDISSVGECGTINNTVEMEYDKSPSRARMIVHNGDTIISTVRTYLKAIAYIDNPQNIICSTGFCVVSPTQEFFPKYLYYFLQSEYCVQKIVSKSVGVSYPAINASEIGNIKIVYPDLAQQKKASEYLDDICDKINLLINRKEKTNKLLKEYRHSTIYKAVTKGLDSFAPTKESGIEWFGDIPRSWDLRKIKYLFTIVSGATPKSGDGNYWDGDIPWITPADYTTEDMYVSAGHKYITQEGFDSCGTSMIPAGSIIFSKRAPVGLVAISSNPLCTNQGCLSCIPKDNVDVKYYYYAMSICKEQFELYASGTTFKEISADTFASFKLPYPDYAEQQRIASWLDMKCSEIDKAIAANDASISRLKEYRQSLIYEVVTGKIEV